jgi:hypothetical protein
MNLLLRFKSFWACTILTAFLLSSAACTYKPAYLQQGKKAQVSERWKVEKINTALLSPDEKSVYETFGPPEFIRFFRRLSLEREKVYAWVYREPVRFITFIDGKKVDYAVLDDDLSSLNEYQREMLFWGKITAGVVAGLGLLYYLIFAKK